MEQQHKFDVKVVYRLLESPATYATVLHAICLKQYGEDIYDVDPIELYHRLQDDFGVQPCEDNENKLNAILNVMVGDAFYQQLDAFVAICNTFSEGDPGIGLDNDLTVPEIFWGIYEVEVNRLPIKFSRAIEEMIESNLSNEADEPEERQDMFQYVWAYVKEHRHLLKEQLDSLGFEHTELPPAEPNAALQPGVS